MIQAEAVRLILMQEFIEAQTRNPNYSMRAYAKRIGVAQSAVSEILSGKRPISKKAAQRILAGLDRAPDEVSQFLGDDDTSGQKFNPLEIDAFYLISDWHYYAILSLAETKDFKSSSAWIAERLGIQEKVASAAIKKLVQLKMLLEDKKTGRLTVTGQQFEATSKTANAALKAANRQNLELASSALDSVPAEERDFSAITLCFDPARINEARKMIKIFRRSFSRVMESGHKKDVYKLCIQLFPLSKRNKKI